MSTISVIIPVKNGAATIAQCLDGIKQQTLIHKTEVIIIDSGSTDNTLEILKNYPFIRFYQIAPEEFNHGITRNYGVSLAKGEFVVMTVQDAYAMNNRWLEIMLAHFQDKAVAAVTGQQVVPHEQDKNPHQWFRPQSETSIHHYQFSSPEKFNKLNPQEQFYHCRVDDVNTMYRTSALKKILFHEMPFGEDIQWAKNALMSGYKIVFDNHARVFHYHHQTFEYAFQVNYILNIYMHKIFNLVPENTLSIKDILLIIYRNFKYKAHIKWIFFNFKILWAKQKAYKTSLKQLKSVNNKINIPVPQGKQNLNN